MSSKFSFEMANLLERNIVRFFIVGAITTAIDWGLYFLLNIFFTIFVSKVCSMLLASIFSYFLNKAWTFANSDERQVRYLWKYYIAFLVNVAVNSLTNACAFNVTGKKILSLGMATGTATIINFCLQKFWVFREEKK